MAITTQLTASEALTGVHLYHHLHRLVHSSTISLAARSEKLVTSRPQSQAHKPALIPLITSFFNHFSNIITARHLDHRKHPLDLKWHSQVQISAPGPSKHQGSSGQLLAVSKTHAPAVASSMLSMRCSQVSVVCAHCKRSTLTRKRLIS